MRAVSLVVVLATAAACSARVSSGGPGADGDGGPGDGRLTDGLGGDGAVGDATVGDAYDPCAPTAAPPPVDEQRTLVLGGLARTYYVHVPATYAHSPTPVVLNFHGFGGSALQQQQMTRMNAAADANGFIAIHPDGTGPTKAWNAGACCPPNNPVTVDDVAFTTAMIDEVSSRICVNRKRVYATGFSNGAFMAYRLACELSNRIAAIVPVAGVIGVASCSPARPVPVGHLHGMRDTYVPYDGSPSVVGATFASVPFSVQSWATINGCSGAPVVTFTNGDTTCYQYGGGCTSGADVAACLSADAGHSWPGALPAEAPGEVTTQSIDATTAMWQFMSRYALP